MEKRTFFLGNKLGTHKPPNVYSVAVENKKIVLTFPENQ